MATKPSRTREREPEPTLTERLLTASGEKPRAKGESGRDFIVRVCKALSRLEDAEYNAMDNECMEFAHDAIEAVSDKLWAKVPLLDGVSAEEEEPVKAKEPDEDKPPVRSRPRLVEEDDPPPRKRSRDDRDDDADDDDDKPRRSRAVVEEDDPPPRKRATRDDDDEDEKPVRRSRARDDDDEKPVRRARGEEKPARSRASDDGEESKSRGRPGRKRGTGLLYDIARIVADHPTWDEDAVCDELDRLKVKYDEKNIKPISNAIRTWQNFIEILREKGAFVEMKQRR